jgi:hypothetical protein
VPASAGRSPRTSCARVGQPPGRPQSQRKRARVGGRGGFVLIVRPSSTNAARSSPACLPRSSRGAASGSVAPRRRHAAYARKGRRRDALLQGRGQPWDRCAEVSAYLEGVQGAGRGEWRGGAALAAGDDMVDRGGMSDDRVDRAGHRGCGRDGQPRARLWALVNRIGYGITSTNASWSSAPEFRRGWMAGSVERPMKLVHSSGVSGLTTLRLSLQIVATRPFTASMSM